MTQCNYKCPYYEATTFLDALKQTDAGVTWAEMNPPTMTDVQIQLNKIEDKLDWIARKTDCSGCTGRGPCLICIKHVQLEPRSKVFDSQDRYEIRFDSPWTFYDSKRSMP